MPDGEIEPFRMGHLTWEEAGEAFESADYVVLPCGATEQHGRHLPLSVDTIRAERMTEELARAAPEHDLDVRALPALPYGYSEHHMTFPGTVTLTPETYRRVIVEIGSCLAEHGAERFLLLNAHGGNESTLQLAADELNREADLPTHYVDWGDWATESLEKHFEDWGHSGAHETSVLEHYEPHLVRADRKKAPERKPTAKTRSVRYISEKTVDGNTADPRESDPDAIEEVIEETTDRILRALADDTEIEF